MAVMINRFKTALFSYFEVIIVNEERLLCENCCMRIEIPKAL